MIFKLVQRAKDIRDRKLRVKPRHGASTFFLVKVVSYLLVIRNTESPICMYNYRVGQKLHT